MNQEQLKQYAQEKLQKNQQLLQERQVFGESFNPTKLSISPQIKNPPQMLRSDILNSSRSSPGNSNLSKSQTDIFYVRVRKNLRSDEDDQLEELKKDQLIKKLQKERQELTAKGLGQISPRSQTKSDYAGRLRAVLQKKEAQELSKFRKIATKLYERECDRLMKSGAAQIQVINLFQIKNAPMGAPSGSEGENNKFRQTLQVGCVFNKRQQIALATFGCRFTASELLLTAKYAGIKEAAFADFLEVPAEQRQMIVASLLTRSETIVILDRPTETEGRPVITIGFNAALVAAAVLNSLDTEGKAPAIDFGIKKLYLGDKRVMQRGKKADFIPKIIVYAPKNICNQFSLCIHQLLENWQFDFYLVDEDGLMTSDRQDYDHSKLARKDLSNWGHRTFDDVLKKVGVDVLILIGWKPGTLSRDAETMLNGKVIIDVGGMRLGGIQISSKQQNQSEKLNGLTVAQGMPSCLTQNQTQNLLTQKTIIASQQAIKYISADGSQRIVQLLSQVYLARVLFYALRALIDPADQMPALPNDLILYAARVLLQLQAGRYCGFITPEGALKEAEILVRREMERRGIGSKK